MSTTASKLRMRSMMGSVRIVPADAADVAAEILEIVRAIRNGSDAKEGVAHLVDKLLVADRELERLEQQPEPR